MTKPAWLTTEIATLTATYPTDGAAGVQRLLPARTLSAIRAKAAQLRIKCTRPPTLGMRFTRMYEQRADIDTMVREGYVHARKKGDIKALATRVGRPAWWVQKRAAALGVTRSNATRVDCWLPAEDDLLEHWAAANLDVIARKLRAAGYSRTPTAIGTRLKRRQIDRTDPDAWTATQLGPLFGVNPKTIADWVERRGLPAKRVAHGPNGKHIIRRADLRRWIKASPQYVDLRRVDTVWFWEVMFGGAA